MIATFLLAGALSLPPVQLPHDGRDGALALLELSSERTGAFVHEPLRLALRVWIAADLPAEGLVQPFRRPLDLPVEVHARGLRELTAVRWLEREDSAQVEGPSFALDDALAHARVLEPQEHGGRLYRGWEHALFLLPTRPGLLELPPPRLRLVYATEFREDFLAGRVPVELRELEAQAAPLALEILPLPEAGRPAEFSGGVDRFTLEARLEPASVVLGASVRLELVLAGSGELSLIEPPRLAELPGFHLYGLLDERDGEGRRWTYDLAPRSVEPSEVPAIGLWTFDPTPPGTYRRIETRPLPLEVLPGPGGERQLDAPVLATSEVRPSESDASDDARPRAWLAVLLAAAAIVAAVLALRRPRTNAPAAATAAPGLASSAPVARDTNPEARLAEQLAARLGTRPAALIGPGLARRLEGAGLPREVAAASAALLEQLVAARYGGPAVERAAGRVEELLAQLERAARGSRPAAEG